MVDDIFDNHSVLHYIIANSDKACSTVESSQTAVAGRKRSGYARLIAADYGKDHFCLKDSIMCGF